MAIGSFCLRQSPLVIPRRLGTCLGSGQVETADLRRACPLPSRPSWRLSPRLVLKCAALRAGAPQRRGALVLIFEPRRKWSRGVAGGRFVSTDRLAFVCFELRC